MKRLILNKEKLLAHFQDYVDAANDCLDRDGDINEECYDAINFVTHMSNMFAGEDPYYELNEKSWNNHDTVDVEEVHSTIDKMFEGIVDIIDDDDIDDDLE